MISTEGALTYRQLPRAINTWRPESDLLNEILIAALLTVLSYQVAAIVLDLFLGLKHNGQAPLHDLQVQLLVGNSSPRAIIRALFPREFPAWKDRNAYSAELRDDYADKFHFGTIFKLFFLLVAIPFINMATVVLSLERNQHLSVQQTKFGGVYLGINFDNPIRNWKPLSEDCQTTSLETARQEFSTIDFNVCVLNAFNVASEPAERYANFSQYSSLIIEIGGLGQYVSINVQVNDWLVVKAKYSAILSKLPAEDIQSIQTGKNQTENRVLYHIPENITEDAANRLVTLGLAAAADWCGDGKLEERVWSPEGERGQFYKFSKKCNPLDKNRGTEVQQRIANNIANKMIEHITLIDGQKFELLVSGAPGEAENRVDGGNLRIITRRLSLISIPMLGMIVGGVVILRYAIALLARNDLAQGISLIVRDGLGLPCCDSMLSCHDVTARFDPNVCELRSVD